MKRVVFLLVFFLYSAISWGQQTWKLTETMSANLDDKGVLTITTTANSEAMPNFIDNIPPWYTVRGNIRSILFGDKVTVIGENAFDNCHNVISVTIPNSVTTISGSVFFGCVSLPSITIPNSVTSIGNLAFGNCYSLTSVTIPNSVESIGFRAFSQCVSLTSIQVSSGNTAYSSDDGILFNHDKTILHTFPAGKSNVVIPASVTAIGDGAFFGYTGLPHLTIPNSVTSIGNRTFMHCSGLTAIVIPGSVTSIGEDAFLTCSNLTANCTSLESVTVEWETPLSVPNLFNWGTSAVNTSTATLFVPSGTKGLYEVADVWKDFGTIVEYNFTNTSYIEAQTLKIYASNGILNISGLQLGKPLNIYNINGQSVYKGITKSETEQISLSMQGFYVIVAGNQTITVILKK